MMRLLILSLTLLLLPVTANAEQLELFFHVNIALGDDESILHEQNGLIPDWSVLDTGGKFLIHAAIDRRSPFLSHYGVETATPHE